MTVRKHLKQLVRQRMTKTGESYTTARRQLIRRAPSATTEARLRWHFPGNVPAATALRVLLSAAGVHNPATEKPFSEAMVFGIAGGIGVGVCTFHYAKEDFASFFVAGRHLWYEDLVYLKEAAARFGLKPAVKETSGARSADKHLREMLAAGPCIAWVDMALLPHRALPMMWCGGDYHVVTVYKIEGDHALIGDLADKPITISLKDLATSRARIKKQKHRLLSLAAASSKELDLQRLVAAGLRACHQGFTQKPFKVFPNMCNLDGLRQWAERLHGSNDKQSWETIFPRGINLWRGLSSMHQFIEHYGAGGGLCRPLFAEFLEEIGDVLGERRFRSLAARYADLGRDWSALAQAALPDSVPLFRRARACYRRYRELLSSGGTIEQKRADWAELDQIAAQTKNDFPLTDSECGELRAELQGRVQALVAKEQAALTEIAAVVSAMR